MQQPIKNEKKKQLLQLIAANYRFSNVHSFFLSFIKKNR